MAIADQLDRLNVLRKNLAAELTDKGVTAESIEGFETLVPKVGTIETGVQLPELTNPASAADIASGKQAINASGEVLTGTAVKGLLLYQTYNGKIARGGSATFSIQAEKIAMHSTFWCNGRYELHISYSGSVQEAQYLSSTVINVSVSYNNGTYTVVLKNMGRYEIDFKPTNDRGSPLFIYKG